MTEKFVLWNQDKARYLKKGCDMKTVNDGRAKHAKHLDEAEVFEDYDIAKEYMHALNEATKRFFYLGDPWGVINFDFTDHFCEKNAEDLVEELKAIDPRVTGEEAAESIKEASKNIREAMTPKALTRTSPATRCGTCERFDCVCLKCPLSGLPIVACGCDGCERLLSDIAPDKHNKPTSLAEDAGEPEEDEDEAIKPNHYAQGAGGATFDVIEALYQVLPWGQFKGYMKGNIIKYTVRYDAKNGTEDVEKAAEYNRRLMAYELREGAKNAD
ncbi:hypothetical protein [Lactococcus phage 1358]|uniref:Phage protein n=1 Tax=Lactococcus phage 1358 TaxID=741942 RepID=D3W0H2_9CAUD|nr:hypothetical protein ABG43_gp41 [Lactococcus phage 1358]ADD25738.1 hypothetical protein [Lactococcus phage 1358]